MSGLLVGEVVRSAAGAAPHRPAVVLGGRALTFAALDAGADRAAGRLAALGVRRGDRVVWPPTGDPVETLRVYAGAARAGAVLVPLARDAWSARVVRAAAPCLVLTDTEAATEGARLATAARVRHAVLTEDAVRTDGDRPGEPEAAETPEENDPHLVLFAGPGRPRGVVLSHRASVLRAHCGGRPEPPGVLVCGFPAGHWGVWTAVLRQWQARGTVVLPEAPGPGAICAAVREHRATRLLCPPEVWWQVLDTAPHHLATLRSADTETAAGATPPRLLEAIRTATPAARVRAFLSTPEAGDVAVLDHADVRARPGSCGVPAPGVAARVAHGELWVRGPLLFDGYLKDKKATDAVLRDGWFRTGRAARLDGDGHLHLTGP
ncbi:class I adenylate-forming enzyme family protein [Streptomyces spectabilis]|uniref:Acyl-CoA synthetase (AMP-forming)/AMP-acid ligase II n=1 Tax=Streptomyces spectabilis TaxID=68270 RepID=A0A5P2X9Z4_STRST|nr:class I adenylate-forming enzyme family protein [Streptomyces spectabilis]MBB5108609.1 acyl-CoA synthetase (AMP-forming)/AMP-acid ligase II [Streptomyces spectabilis]MCI3901824.1 acyl--CoA ligase [Streptomyces spectabilis]QEV59252.1 long-chain fatty acid--CoA ligase [Streptomyces spectabilis]GGV46923.1 AMP-dependent synthetase [Streptomyces spectabilis]